MSRRTFQDWLVVCQSRVSRAACSRRAASPHRRSLRIEPLEDRRLLSITVDTLVDENDGVGVGGISLRDAIATASIGETIDFSVTGTIKLEHGELVIDRDLTIAGPGANLLTIDADGASRVLTVDDGTAGRANVELAGLTFTGGVTGGDGGGIFNQENLSVIASVIVGNRADDGGGIGNFGGGTFSVVDTTISDNVATGISSGGGGIFNFSNSLAQTSLISNSTISGNSAVTRGGGINNFIGTISIDFCTITRNEAPDFAGAGIASWGDQGITSTELYGTIVAGNINTDVDLVGSFQPTFHSNGYNLIGSGTSTGSFVVLGDQRNVANPLLGPLADNGGPTPTHALLIGSPAIDAGDPNAEAGVAAVPESDQRGTPYGRVFDGDNDSLAVIDIGAYESDFVYFVVDTLDDEDDGDFSLGDFSLREAIGEASLVSEGTPVIQFASSLTSEGPATIQLALGELAIVSRLVIDGPSADLLTIDGQGSTRLFYVDDFDNGNQQTVTIRGLTLTGGYDTNGGGAVFSQERLTVSDSVVTGNTAQWGGGIYNAEYGTLTVLRSQIFGNHAIEPIPGAFGSGGGLYNWGGTMSVLDSTISANDSVTDAGGVRNANGGSMFIRRSTISDNTANDAGGGLRNDDGPLQISSSTISGNHADRGGGIFVATPNFQDTTISNSTISGNSAPNGGGGLYSQSGRVLIEFSTITQNVSLDFAGSGVRAAPSSIDAPTTIYSSIIAANFDPGGAVQSDPYDLAVAGEENSLISLGYNIVGIGSFLNDTFNQNGDQIIGTDGPLLGPLADNGGPTFTHALLPGSPAIDAGNPAAVAGLSGVPLYDQRGEGFGRVRDGDAAEGIAIDIGAYEVQQFVAGPALPGDYNDDHIVNAADYTVWRNHLNTNANLPNDETPGFVDESDYQVWKMHFGQTLDEPGSGSDAAPTGGVSGGPIIVTTHLDVVDAGDGFLSLREAIIAANSNPDEDTIEFDMQLFAGGAVTILLLHGEMAITTSVQISGPSMSVLTIDASGSDTTPDEDDGFGTRIFNINDGDDNSLIDVSIVGMTLTGGDVGLDGGAILSSEDLTLVGCALTGNVALDDGGAIYAYLGNLELINSTVSGNKALGPNGDGGGINCNFTATGSLIITSSTIMQNIAGRRGGGITAFRTEVEVTSSNFWSNEVTGPNGAGGAIFTTEGNTSLIDSQVDGNKTTGEFGEGGGLYVVGNLEVVNSNISGNRAEGNSGVGGGIVAKYGTANVLHSTISQNFAPIAGGGIYLFNSSLSLADGIVSLNSSPGNLGFGGGIYGNDDISIVRSSILWNSSLLGGGVHIVVGNLLVEDSLIYGNSANELGGGIYRGVADDPNSTRIVNSTISGNSAGKGGGIINYAHTEIEFSTITNNSANETEGAGIASNSETSLVKIRSSIVAGNGGTDIDNFGIVPGESFESLGYNLIGDGNAAAVFNQPGDQVGVADPLLAPLADNGGPTLTHALLNDSPAVDAGDPAAVPGVDGVPTHDQRGLVFARIRDGNNDETSRIDIGAYERFATTYFVDTLVDESDGDYSEGDLSLREAIELSDMSPEIDTIEFWFNITANGPATILLEQGELQIRSSVIINGPGAELLKIDASGNDPNPNVIGDGTRVFNIDDISSLTVIDVEIRGLTLTGGDVNQSGGAIFTRGRLLAENLVITGNHAAAGGAIAVFVSTGDTLIANCEITNNSASSSGGAITIQGSSTGTAILRDNTISGNTANRGGALYAGQSPSNSQLVITRITLADNTATVAGGAILLNSFGAPKTNITDSTITGNRAGSRGGGISVYGARDLTIANSIISDNHGIVSPFTVKGGGLYNTTGEIAITGSTISGNQGSAGGGIYSKNGELTVSFSSILDNVVGADGGGIWSENDRFLMTGSTVSGNTSNDGDGGGIRISSGQFANPASILDSTIAGNTANFYGGGLYFFSANLASNLSLAGVTISGNAARHGGGAATGLGTIGATSGLLSIQGGAITGNTASINGGGLYSRVANLNINGTTITGNRAGGHGGGIALPNAGGTIVAMSIINSSITGNAAGSPGVVGQGVGDGGGMWIASSAFAGSIVGSQISGNSARRGGGFFRTGNQSVAGSLLVSGSTVSGNTASQHGGGIYNAFGLLSLTSSTVSGNSIGAALNLGNGGGIFSRSTDVTIHNSSLLGNSTASGRGGGLYFNLGGDLSVTGSTIASNSARIDGGGVWLQNSSNDRASIHSSTISNNTSALGSGGLSIRGGVSLRHSTITGNRAGELDPVGAATSGLYLGSSSFIQELDHVIVAGNIGRPGVIPDLRIVLSSIATVRNSLIGDNTGTSLAEAPLGSPDVNGNLIGKPISAGGSGVIDPRLAPLHDNGGPTRTHALLPGSPALDGGALVTTAPQGYDQRGNPYSRMVDGTGDGIVRIDMGAYEAQGIPSFTPGDYNRNGSVTAADYTLWRNMLGSEIAPFDGADGDGDGTVDADDFDVWKSHFGQGLTETLGGSGSIVGNVSTFAFTIQPQALPATTLRSAAVRTTNAGNTLFSHDQALIAWLADRANGGDESLGSDDARASDNSDDKSDAIDAPFDAAFAALQIR